MAQFRPNTAEVSQTTSPSPNDATLEFAVEPKGPRPLAPAPRVPHATSPPDARARRLTLVLLGVLAVAALGATVWFGLTQIGPAVASGSLRVESDPQGAEVLIDGAIRGTTPLSISLPVGKYSLTVRQGSTVKQMPVEIVKGMGSAYHITWTPTPPAPPVQTGSINIVSESPASVVSVDGVDQGQAPLTVHDLAPGVHDVIVRSGNTTYRRSVQVEAGGTASLVITASPSAPAWGWISPDLPFTAQILEGGRIIGTSEVDRIMLPPGDHQIELVAEPFGFRQSSRVRIVAGRQGTLSPTIPQVAMNINAIPWAEVSIDGVRVGDTPLANVMLALGDHELVFRHPQLGEKRQTARVTLRTTPRVSVDMRAR